MKQFRRIFTVITVSAGLTLLFGGIIYAANLTQTVQGTTNKSIYKAGQDITISGTVNGDVFCVGQNVTVNATVNGDIMCAAQTINIDGSVNGNIRAVGQTINVGSKVSKAVSLAGQDIVIEDSANVGQDLSLASKSAIINGTVGRDITGAISNITLNNTIGRNVDVHSGSLSLDSGAKINGGLTYTSPNTFKKIGDAFIQGKVTYHQASTHRNTWHGMIWFRLYLLLATVVLGVVIVALLPRLFKQWNPAWGSNFWWSVLTGFIAMIAVPIVIVILFVTVIGIPLGILLLLLWIVAAILSVPLAAYFSGSLIAGKLHPLLIVLIGAVALGILELIPVLGWIIGLVAYWLGTGILLRGLRASYIKPVYR